jgi:hypothetical protein
VVLGTRFELYWRTRTHCDPSNEMFLILWITSGELDILVLLAWIKSHHLLSDKWYALIISYWDYFSIHKLINATSKLVSLHPNEENLYLWQRYGSSWFLLNVFNHSVHLGLCIAKYVLSFQLIQVVIFIYYLSCGRS